jgi:GNAT superfamily N-acetyltransferase
MPSFDIRPATESDVPLILRFIRDLAEYERLLHLVVATEDLLCETLFGARPYGEVVFACEDGVEVGFAIFFHNYSTFLGQPGIYLEDLFVEPSKRGRGYGKKLLQYLARLCVERNCGRLEWAVLNWNEPSINFYKSLGAKPQDEWQVYRLRDEALRLLASSLP